jgi:exodeoxyribonuclease X
MIALIADTETTGTDPSADEVIELAYKPAGLEGMFHERFKPSKSISWGAMSSHHILFSDLDGCRDSAHAPASLPPCDYLIGHNVDFDWKMLGEPNCKRICTLAMSRELWPEADSHKLGAMMYFVLGATPETRSLVRSAHSAVEDVLMCEKLLERIAAVTKLSSMADLYTFSEEARIPKIMSFGKHKGNPVSSVDRGYANWYRKQPDTDPYLLEAFRRNGLI